MKEEPDQRRQQISRVYVLRNERIRIVIICCSLLALALAFLLFLFTKNVLPVFSSMVLTSLGYKYLDTSLGKFERTQERFVLVPERHESRPGADSEDE